MTSVHASAASSGQLLDVLTFSEPLGPHFTEPLLRRLAAFEQLYDKANHVHASVRSEDPPYIVGRKGAGKTAFLVGAALLNDAEVVLITSENIYGAVESLRRTHERLLGPVYTDTLVAAWQVLLAHGAMLGICHSDSLPESDLRERVWNYVASFDDPKKLHADQLLPQVAAAISQTLERVQPGTTFLSACQSLDLGRGSYASALEAMRAVVDANDGRKKLCVVVDNLEDLHRRLDDLRDTISALFRVTTHDRIAIAADRLPFSLRFAFPAELLPQLRLLTANPEKDFTTPLVIKWTAAELIVLAGHRIRAFLDAHFPGSARALKLPEEHNPDDARAAEQTLRAVLPPGPIENGLGTLEDPVAYIMRHTQLLPRHLIYCLNAILSETFKRAGTAEPPRATRTDVLRGVRAAEKTIVDGILSSHEYAHGDIAGALRLLKNRLSFFLPAATLHREYSRAGVGKATGLGFPEFLESGFAVGAFGIAMDSPTDRYVRAEFAYTFSDDLRPVVSEDHLCIHPLFVYCLFDLHIIRRLGQEGARPIYPYGSDPEDDDPSI